MPFNIELMVCVCVVSERALYKTCWKDTITKKENIILHHHHPSEALHFIIFPRRDSHLNEATLLLTAISLNADDDDDT